jgi:hypothetical protein
MAEGGEPWGLNMIAKIGYGHLWLRRVLIINTLF